VSDSIFKKPPTLKVAVAVLLNLALVLAYPKIALVTGVPRTDALRHLLAGSLAAVAWVVAWHVARRGKGQERTLGIALMALPSIFLVIVVLWAARQW